VVLPRRLGPNIRGFFRTIGDVVRTRRLPDEDADARLAWLVIIATIPVGITGLALEHPFRTVFAKPEAASIFLFVNGLILFAGERFRRHASIQADAAERAVFDRARDSGGRTAQDVALSAASDARLARVSVADSLRIGLLQVAALLPGISRSGITISAGLYQGIRRADATRFSFLLATPVIVGAGVKTLLDARKAEALFAEPDVLAVGFALSFVFGLLAVAFMVRFLRTHSLIWFVPYRLIVAAFAIALALSGR
jgi:undecaprenyl-diphosphatase